jgi:predicted MFS family arabinose efflux permease
MVIPSAACRVGAKRGVTMRRCRVPVVVPTQGWPRTVPANSAAYSALFPQRTAGEPWDRYGLGDREGLMQDRTPVEAVSTANAEAATSSGAAQEAVPISNREKQIVLWLNNVNHMMNHFQNQIVFVMYPAIARELGFGPFELSLLAAARSIFTNWAQLGYGLLTPFVPRFQLLGITSLIYALGTFLSGAAWNLPSFLTVRCVASAGSSSMHPVGTSLLASYFRERRGAVLALNNTISQLGNIMAPVVGGFLLIAIGWRNTFFIVAVLSVLMALAYFFFRDRVRDPSRGSESNRAKLARSKASYFRVLRNRNFLLIALVFLVGGAGRGEVTPTYLPFHLERDFGFDTAFTALVLFLYPLGGLAGPLLFGWISDRGSRKRVIQLSLLLSGLATLVLAWQGPNPLLIVANVIFYGMVTHSRGTLTQAMVADSVSEEDQDAAYSLYFFLGFFSAPIWALVTGFLFQRYNFGIAFSVMATSYVGAMLLMSFAQDVRRPRFRAVQ